MSSHTSREVHQPSPPRQPNLRDESDFVQKATERLTKYYITTVRCTQRIQIEYNIDQLDAFKVPYDEAVKTFHADPVKNPVHFPNMANLDEVREYFRKCDDLCVDTALDLTINECLHIALAMNYGAQFVFNCISGHPKHSEIANTASGRSAQICCPAEVAKASSMKMQLKPWETLTTDQTVLLKQPVDGSSRLYRLVDHGSSAMKGEYWIFREENYQAAIIELSADELNERFIAEYIQATVDFVKTAR